MYVFYKQVLTCGVVEGGSWGLRGVAGSGLPVCCYSIVCFHCFYVFVLGAVGDLLGRPQNGMHTARRSHIQLGGGR